MTEVDVKIKIINTILKTKLPEYATAGSACMDLRASESCIIEPNETKLVGTNIAIELPEGYKLHVVPRSGLASRGIGILNSPGTIDCFSENMKIATINGDKEIKDLTIHDICISFNEETFEVEKNKVLAIIDKGELDILKIELEDKTVLEITENTPVYTNNGIILAKNLTINDKVIKIM